MISAETSSQKQWDQLAEPEVIHTPELQRHLAWLTNTSPGESLGYKARCSLPGASTLDTWPLGTQLWLGTEKSPGQLPLSSHYLLRNPSAEAMQ